MTGTGSWNATTNPTPGSTLLVTFPEKTAEFGLESWAPKSETISETNGSALDDETASSQRSHNS